VLHALEIAEPGQVSLNLINMLIVAFLSAEFEQRNRIRFKLQRMLSVEITAR